jgi:opacity protein-like surface antigen
MKVLSVAVVLVALAAGPAFAQTERGYITGAGGFAVSPDATSGDVLGEVGVRVGPHLMVFGDVGQIHNLQPSDIQPAIDNTTSALAGFTGLGVVGTGRVPAWYSLGGVRYEAPARARVSPYVLGGLGFARLTPTATFTYSSGTLPDGTVPTVGADITSTLLSAGDFTAPPASTAFMFTLGGGVEVPVAQHWAADIGYRFSRIAAATPVDSQGATFGFGYRF